MPTLSAGHVFVSHTADLRIEAWAPTRARCLAEAVEALVDSFIDRPRPEPSTAIDWLLPDNDTENPLADLLDEVIYQMDVYARIPVATVVEPATIGWQVRFEMADLSTATPCGAVPKAVSRQEIRFRREENGWRCEVTIDV
ncbi:archease [Nocardia vaccinii]|uniref:archease n=1 Tax=Nocardia vaccinii TaxID=1822 RepID=UPI00082E8D30|nr:archease [Nocardia vaccinii]